MKLPQSLHKYDGKPLPEAEDGALVKLGTLKSAIALVLRHIPIPGGGLAVRRSKDGDVWTQSAEIRPFYVSSLGKVHPGLVGGLMPTLGGEPLDETENLIDLSSDDKVWFKLTFTVNYVEDYLAPDYTLDSVEVDQGASLPSDSDSVKYLQFNAITSGTPSASYFQNSIAISLYDAGANATGLLYS